MSLLHKAQIAQASRTTSAVSLGTSYTEITTNSNDYNPENFSYDNSRIEVERDGWYLIRATVQLEMGTSGAHFCDADLILEKGSSIFGPIGLSQSYHVCISIADYQTVSFFVVDDLSANDEIRLVGLKDNSSYPTLAADPNGTRITVEYLGDDA